MKRNTRSAAYAVMLAAAAAIGVSACGGSSGQSTAASQKTPTATVVEAGFPDSLDPQVGATTASTEATWNVYLGLYTYAHAAGAPGTRIIPALAQSLPKIEDGGKTYLVTLRKGLRYSNGAPVKASDFTHAIERAIKLNWASKSFLTEHIEGAEAFDEGKASSISGIEADDSTGLITIKLTAPFGPFLNVLAFPAAGLVPGSTPLKAQPNDPPPGAGPYQIVNVKPSRSFEERINPHWSAQAIQGIPTPKSNVLVKVQSNSNAEADEVLGGQADLYDWNSPLPPSAVQQAKREASGRYQVKPVSQVSFFFLNVTEPPFDNPLARRAVQYALNRPAFQRLASGYLTPGCYLLPPGIVGHPSAPCPYGEASSTGDVKKGKQLVQQSGTAGDEVTVWGLGASPYKEYVDAYAQTLKEIGYRTNEKVISPATYFPTITSLKTKAQTGFAEYTQDFPNPADFYPLIDGKSIHPEGNMDLSLAKDHLIESEVEKLGDAPASQLPSEAGAWESLERHTAKEAYLAVIGYQDAPELASSRVSFGALVFSPVYGPDWSTLEVK